MRRLPLVLVLVVLAGCGGKAPLVEVPNNHGHPLGDALQRLHAAGLRATFPASSTPCGDGVPAVIVQDPRAPERVRRGSTVSLRLFGGFIPSPAVPLHHERWTIVPDVVGHDFGYVEKTLHAVWPCVHVLGARSTDSTRLVVIAQKPAAGARVPAYGVLVRGGGYRPTTVDLTVAAQ